MAIAQKIQDTLNSSSFIRKMFEEGMRLKKEFGAENVFDFSIGNPDLPPPDRFYEVIRKFADEKTPGKSGYMPNAGFPEVREKIAAKAGSDHGVKLSGANIVMCVGAAGGLNVLFKTILNPEDEVITPTPYFVEYNAYVGNHGGRLVTVKTNQDFSLNIDVIRKAVNERTAAVLINSPNNPTGVVYPQKDIAALGEMLARESERIGRTIHLVSDEPYREIVYDGVTVPGILCNYKNSVVVTSYSKSLSLPGERIGYIAVNPECDDADALISGLIMCTRTLGFVNAPALLQRAVAELTAERVAVEVYKRRRDRLTAGLTEAGFNVTAPEGAFYYFVKAPVENDIEFVNHLKEYYILVVPGSGFGAPGYFRLSYSVDESVIERSIPVFVKAMKEFRK